jgi:hypothetical protein
MSISRSVKVLTHDGKTVSISNHRVTSFPCHKPSNIFGLYQWINGPADADMLFEPSLFGASTDSSETPVFYLMEK